MSSGSERVAWNAGPETLLDVVEPGRAELGAEILTLVAEVAGHAVRFTDVVRTTRSVVYTQLHSTPQPQPI